MKPTDMTADRSRILVYRGEVVESRHRVSFAVANAAGEITQARGIIDRPVFPRSAIKMLQAIPLVETGAAARFELSAEELALACASHNGEPRHANAVASWLQRLGFSPDDLECGTHPPSHAPSARALANAGRSPSSLHNNCSGKHAGMLTLARHLDTEANGYIRPDHPVQQIIRKALEEMTGFSPWPDPAIDGCGIPTFAIPLQNLAIAMARFADPVNLAPPRDKACHQLAAAMMQHPYMVAGEGRPCTEIMHALPGLVVKTGAEGVFSCALPKHGLGFALKIEDGATRASSVALMALLDHLGAITDDARAPLKDLARPILKNHTGVVVGHIEPSQTW